MKTHILKIIVTQTHKKGFVMVNQKINTYQVVSCRRGWYIEATISQARRFCGEGPAGKNIAKNLADKWNKASENYKEKTEENKK